MAAEEGYGGCVLTSSDAADAAFGLIRPTQIPVPPVGRLPSVCVGRISEAHPP